MKELIQYVLFLFVSIVICSCTTKSEHSLAIVYMQAEPELLFSDSLGIYVEGIGRGENWQGEKANYFEGRKIPARFQFFEDGELKIQQKVGLKVSGGGSRKLPQKSFNIYTSKKYGKNNLDYPFFKNRPYQSYKSLRLRVSGQDWHETHFRDALMHSLIDEMKVYNQAYRPVVLYLNGEYWGIYNLREKFNETYIRQRQGWDSSMEFDILERRMRVEEGDSLAWSEFLQFVQEEDLGQAQNFERLCSMIDTAHFLDYYSAQIYFANTDWPGNNIKFWKARGDCAKWSWFIHDTDLGFGLAPLYMHPGGVDHNTLAFNMNDKETDLHNPPWATLLFRKMMTNPTFNHRFFQHFEELLNNEFHPQRVISMIDSLENQLLPEMPGHLSRWKNRGETLPRDVEEWRMEVEQLREFARKRPQYLRKFFH